MTAPSIISDAEPLTIVGTRVVSEHNGWTVLALLSDGTAASPMGQPVRATAAEAAKDAAHIVMDGSGPVYEGRSS